MFVTWDAECQGQGGPTGGAGCAAVRAAAERLPGGHVARKEAERAEGLAKLKRLVARKVEKRLAS